MKNAQLKIKAPDWLYKEANISKNDVHLIKLELLKYINAWALQNNTKLMDIKSQFIGIDIRKNNNLVSSLPVLMNVLGNFGIDKLLSVLAFIVVTPDKYFPIHIDCEDPTVMSFALNIPVLNCEDTVTVWYDTLPESESQYSIAGTYHGEHATVCSQSNAKEIGKCEANTPHWVNISKPHAPVCSHSKLRINASLRFTPEIYNFIEDGSLENKMIIS